VALTIDDGPDPVTTAKILDVLRQHDARATFFLIGERVPGNEEIVARIVEEGHELGNHLMRDEPSFLLGPAEFERQLTATHAMLSTYGEVRWFRPGSGSYDRAMLSTLERHGYTCVLGSVYPFDAHVGSVGFAARHIPLNAGPGSIVLLHDRGPRGERTAEVLARVLPELNRRGLRVVGLSELLATNVE